MSHAIEFFQRDTIEKLTKIWENWCLVNYYPLMSADELIIMERLSEDELKWVKAFIAMWEAT